MNRSTDILLSIRNVRKRYLEHSDSPVEAVSGISFDIYRGEFLAITGRSGSGKSTLINLIGLIDRPSEGSILLEGQDLSRLGENDANRYRLQSVSFVFQTYNLLDRFTAAENIALQLELQGEETGSSLAKAREILDFLGLGHRADRYPNELSGGEQQRIAIGRALTKNSKIILADEPTANLDSKNADLVLELFRNIKKEFGRTIVLVTHEREYAKTADRTVVMQDGKILEIVSGTNSPNAVSLSVETHT